MDQQVAGCFGDALVIPSLYESFGLVVLEALACGCPVIASRVGEMESLIKEKHNGLSFRPKDVASLVESLKYIFQNKSRMWSASQIRKDVVREYSWEKTADCTRELFLKLAGFSGT